MEKNFISLSMKASLPLAQAVDEYCEQERRDRSSALRYLVEIGLAACDLGFDQGLLKLSSVHKNKSK